jgi:hypothetical protein
VEPDRIVEGALNHLLVRRDALRTEIENHQSGLKAASKELAKVEQAIAGLRPLGHQSLLTKVAPVLAVAGGISLVLLAAMSASQNGLGEALPPASDLIVLILHEGGEMTDEEILVRMEELGWTSIAIDRLGLLRSYLSRLVQQQRIVRVHQSTYQLAVSDDSLNEVAQMEKGGGS